MLPKCKRLFKTKFVSYHINMSDASCGNTKVNKRFAIATKHLQILEVKAQEELKMGQNSYEPQKHVYGKYKTHVKQIKIQEKHVIIKLNKTFDKLDAY